MDKRLISIVPSGTPCLSRSAGEIPSRAVGTGPFRTYGTRLITNALRL